MEVRATCRWVAEHASHVTINAKGIEKVVEEVNGTLPDIKWDFEGIHFFDNGPLTAQYMLVLDALNFCFWPDEELHYEHLARGLKCALEADNTAFDAERLQTYTGPLLRKLLQWPRKLPLEDERARLIREVGLALEKHFGGLASNLVVASKGSAVALVELVVSHFPVVMQICGDSTEGSAILHHNDLSMPTINRLYDNDPPKENQWEGISLKKPFPVSHTCASFGFRDHSIYKSRQIFIYKRAQIFVADLWGAFQGQGLGEFRDIGCITMFADYVVPAMLRQKGVLEYSPSLANAVDHQQELTPGSEEEVEIRACTVTAIEQLRESLKQIGQEVTSVQVDWWLWSCGIETLKSPSFHHTKTVYY